MEFLYRFLQVMIYHILDIVIRFTHIIIWKISFFQVLEFTFSSRCTFYLCHVALLVLYYYFNFFNKKFKAILFYYFSILFYMILLTDLYFTLVLVCLKLQLNMKNSSTVRILLSSNSSFITLYRMYRKSYVLNISFKILL